MSKSVAIATVFHAKPGMEEAVREELSWMIGQVVSEPHYLRVNLHQDAQVATRFMLYECWSDKEYYHGAHMRTLHMRGHLRKIAAMLDESPRVLHW